MFNVDFRTAQSTDIISIIIPVYKDVSGLTDTVNSIKECLLPSGKRLEIIVVNDGNDPLITAFCKKAGTIEIGISPNLGSYHARNRGMEFSKGSLIGFVDADIFVDKYWIVNATQQLNNHPYVAGTIKVLSDTQSSTVVKYQQLIDFNTRWHLETMHYGPTANIWITRALVEQVGGFDERIYSGGDMEFGARVFEHSPNNQVFSENVLVGHPPRTLRGLLEKSKRLANGHNTIGTTGKLASAFTITESIKRNLGHHTSNRKLPLDVQALRIILFMHRLAFKIAYKLFKPNNKFVINEKREPTVTFFDYRKDI